MVLDLDINHKESKHLKNEGDLNTCQSSCGQCTKNGKRDLSTTEGLIKL